MYQVKSSSQSTFFSLIICSALHLVLQKFTPDLCMNFIRFMFTLCLTLSSAYIRPIAWFSPVPRTIQCYTNRFIPLLYQYTYSRLYTWLLCRLGSFDNSFVSLLPIVITWLRQRRLQKRVALSHHLPTAIHILHLYIYIFFSKPHARANENETKRSASSPARQSFSASCERRTRSSSYCLRTNEILHACQNFFFFFLQFAMLLYRCIRRPTTNHVVHASACTLRFRDKRGERRNLK